MSFFILITSLLTDTARGNWMLKSLFCSSLDAAPVVRRTVTPSVSVV